MTGSDTAQVRHGETTAKGPGCLSTLLIGTILLLMVAVWALLAEGVVMWGCGGIVFAVALAAFGYDLLTKLKAMSQSPYFGAADLVLDPVTLAVGGTGQASLRVQTREPMTVTRATVGLFCMDFRAAKTSAPQEGAWQPISRTTVNVTDQVIAERDGLYLQAPIQVPAGAPPSGERCM